MNREVIKEEFIRKFSSMSKEEKFDYIVYHAKQRKIKVGRVDSYTISRVDEFNYTESTEEEFKKNLRVVFDTLDGIFGDNWSFEVEDLYFTIINRPITKTRICYGGEEIKSIVYENRISYSFSLKLIIKFEEIEIKNSKGLSHIMQDLFVSLNFRLKYYHELRPVVSFSELRGLRMKMNSSEIMSNYQHSHIPGASYNLSHQVKEEYGENAVVTRERIISSFGGDIPPSLQFRPFCLGTNDISSVLGKNKSEDVELEDYIKMITMFLEVFLSWESLEGVPYMKIKDIANRETLPRLTKTTISSEAKRILKYYSDTDEEVNLDYRVSGKDITISDNEKFENFLKYKGPNISEYRDEITANKDPKGGYIKNRGTMKVEDIPNYYLCEQEYLDYFPLIFKGEKITLQVVEDNFNTEVSDEFYIHPKIKENVKRKLEQKIKERRLSTYITKRFSQINNS